MKIWRMRISFLIPKATNKHTDCVIFIAFSLQQWTHEYASMLLNTYTAFRVFSVFIIKMKMIHAQQARSVESAHILTFFTLPSLSSLLWC
jgi:hypothetical protein